MKVNAPADRKTNKARLNWLLRQLAMSKPDSIHIRLLWPGRAAATQHPLTLFRKNPEKAEEPSKLASSFQLLFVRDLGPRFAQRRNSIVELEQAIPDFYEHVGQHLKAWQPQAPRVKPDRLEPEDVAKEALQEEAEAAVADRNVSSP